MIRYKDTMKAEEVEELNNKIANVRKLLAAEPVDGAAVNEATSDLQSYSLKAFESSYKAQAERNNSSSSSSSSQEAKDEPIDADFKDVNNKK